MRRTLLMAILVLLLAACAAPTPLPGSNAAVLERINMLTDCRELKATADRAFANVNRYSAGKQVADHHWAVWQAANDRHHAVGCYR